MPIAMPTIVSPVRTGRRISPRVTTVKKVMSVLVLSASETMRPSFISMMRAAWRAMPRSCVTRMSVMFCSRRRPHDQVEDQVRVFAVEIARRLVGEQDGRAIGEAARDGDALAFAAGELGGKMMQTRFESDGFQQFDGPVFSLGDRSGAFQTSGSARSRAR